MNTNTGVVSVNPGRFIERINGFSAAKNIVSGQELSLKEVFSVPAYTTLVLELK
jgi:hypothetical protein